MLRHFSANAPRFVDIARHLDARRPERPTALKWSPRPGGGKPARISTRKWRTMDGGRCRRSAGARWNALVVESLTANGNLGSTTELTRPASLNAIASDFPTSNLILAGISPNV